VLPHRCRKASPLVMVVIGVLAYSGHLRAQSSLVGRPYAATDLSAEQDTYWAELARLPRGSLIKLVRCEGATIRGQMILWTTNSVVLDTSGSQTPIDRASISQIFRISSNRATRARWGFVTGATLGAVQGLALTKSNREQWAFLFAAGWGGVGAAIGALTGGQETHVYHHQCTSR
jgi:hypothetical protein